METRRTHLKVKIKSLAAEAKIIRSEEQKHSDKKKDGEWTGDRSSLYLHRIGIVRSVARHALLAYGFLRGMDYTKLERNAKVAPDWADVRTQVKLFGIQKRADESHSEFEARKNAELAAFDAWVPAES